MPHRACPRHGSDYPCTCAMGHLYRFVEPVLLLLLQRKGRAHGYELAAELHAHALTDAEIEVSALYKTLRQLEKNQCVTSEWMVDGTGPARRLYSLTPAGEQHLKEWTTVLEHMSKAMALFVAEARSTEKRPGPDARRGLERDRANSKQPKKQSRMKGNINENSVANK